jgi:hypothetical protein
VKTFLITFVISTVSSVVLWQFGLGKIMWPAHPFLATLLTALACGIAAQMLFSRNSAFLDSKK